MEILGVSGSLRRASYNTALLRAAERALPPGAALRPYAGLGSLPPFNADEEEREPLAVRLWREAIERADAVLFATPEYNASVPGHLKNAVDWASRPVGEAALAGKPVAVVSASTGQYGALWAQDDLRKALGVAGARVLDAGLAVPRAHELVEGDRLRLAPPQEESLARLLDELVREAVPALSAA